MRSSGCSLECVTVSEKCSHGPRGEVKTKTYVHATMQGDTISSFSYGGFLSHRGTPSHHPFLDGIFPNINGYTPMTIESYSCQALRKMGRCLLLLAGAQLGCGIFRHSQHPNYAAKDTFIIHQEQSLIIISRCSSLIQAHSCG